MIEQFGYHQRVTSGWIDVAFPITFINTPFLNAIPCRYDNSGSITWKNTFTSVTTSNFRYNNNGQTYQSWIAKGY